MIKNGRNFLDLDVDEEQICRCRLLCSPKYLLNKCSLERLYALIQPSQAIDNHD